MDALSQYLALENGALNKRIEQLEEDILALKHLISAQHYQQEEMERQHSVEVGELIGQNQTIRRSYYAMKDKYLMMREHARHMERRIITGQGRWIPTETIDAVGRNVRRRLTYESEDFEEVDLTSEE